MICPLKVKEFTYPTSQQCDSSCAWCMALTEYGADEPERYVCAIAMLASGAASHPANTERFDDAR